MTMSYNLKVRNLSKVVKVKGKKKTILNQASFDIEQGSFTAVVGVSGAGKTTLMNMLCGYSSVSSGDIYYNDMNFNRNSSNFKGEIGYVPQKEILHEDITLFDCLKYTIQLMDKNIKEKELKQKILETVHLLEIDYALNTLIRNLSGGEKKRASIAVELLRNPKILFLDEPTSGLDSNIEKKLMKKLREIASQGKTVFITAHTVSNLYLCDNIIFMGQGGNICHIGNYQESLTYFDVQEFVDIYDLLKEDTNYWHQKHVTENHYEKVKEQPIAMEKNKKATGFFHQLKVLIKRNLKLKFNNKFLLGILLLQAPVMAIAIYIAVQKDVFSTYQTAKFVLFGFTCAAIWLGMFNSVQEISREFSVSKKEYMSSLNFSSYMVSKVFILGIICFVQMFLLIGVDYILIDFPPNGILTSYPFLEYIFQYFLVSFSAGCMGIFISAIVDRTETTMVVLPIYMMFQLLFTGVLVPLSEFAEKISYVMTARWGVAGFGVIANLEQIASQYAEPGLMSVYLTEAKDLFPHSVSYLYSVWGILAAVAIVFLILSIICIHFRLKRDF